MTSLTCNEKQLECPICLQTFVAPLTLPCGHTYSFQKYRYCEPCIKHTHFKHVKKQCPVCRQKLLIDVNFFCVNLVLDSILKQKFSKDQKYLSRVRSCKKYEFPSRAQEIYQKMKLFLKKSLPWVIIMMLLYHLVRVKINVFYMLLERYKTKALSIAEQIKKQNSLDFKFLLFSQFMRILFSNIAIP